MPAKRADTINEIVLIAQGSSARQSSFTEGKPVDATVIAVIDSIDVKSKAVYKKY